jgi:hypothetical protein
MLLLAAGAANNSIVRLFTRKNVTFTLKVSVFPPETMALSPT